MVVWRLDRLGRTASGLTTLFEKLTARQVGLVSIRDGLDLATAAGRLMANVLASVAAYENEVRGERIVAGQNAARAAGLSRPTVYSVLQEGHCFGGTPSSCRQALADVVKGT